MPILNPDDPVVTAPSSPVPIPPAPTPLPPVYQEPGDPVFPYDQDVRALPPDVIGDIPPPPVPASPRRQRAAVPPSAPPAPSAFARPGSVGMRPYRTTPYQQPRFGPGVPIVGSAGDSGLPNDNDLGLTPEEVAELLRSMAAGS